MKRPVRSRQAEHAAEQAPRRARLEQHRSVRPPRQIGDPEPHRLDRLRGLARQVGGDAAPPRLARPPPRAQAAGRRTRRADRGAQIHQSLRVIARVICIHQQPREALEFHLRAAQRRLDCKKPRHDPLDIAVHHIGGLAKRDGRHRRRRVAPDPRQFEQSGLGRRKAPPGFPPRPWRKRADCGPGRSSRAPPRRHDLGASAAASVLDARPASVNASK